jgi:hypothetical protein
MIFRLTVFISALFLFIACSSENRCYESSESLVVATFTGSDQENIDSLIVKGVGRDQIGDTLVYDTIQSTSKHFELPLAVTVDSTGFQIFSNGKSATLYIRHSMIIKLISDVCGFAPEYQIKDFSFSSNIDSVKITDAVVNTKSAETHAKDQNITIYFNLSDN